ncbi:glycosyltransferase family 9 protein [Sulfurimonas sp. C5]|uniref:glycosyltransferase family 9 protein n=1 Tax=Sulfurimonas sp. C5 TaxID=3036947 RepID=UPI002455CFBA|nr:glycosyltransferase family 9 protein [Sulfurimonas sp. C5]MDH4943446.1 glycosyltransferase family 9 protein [Sulfurimonas sp. C5]
MKVIVIRCGALGDLVYATSVIDALKREYGEDTTIDFVCTPGSAKLFQNDPRINKIFNLKHKKIPLFFSKEKREIVKYSKQHPYDILINFEHGKQFKDLTTAIHAKKKFGSFFDFHGIPDNIIHMVDIIKHVYRNVVSKKVLDSSYPKIIGTRSDDAIKKYAFQEKYIIISPSNSHQKKQRLNYRAWENSKWTKLISLLSKHIQVVVIGNKGEEAFFQELHPYPENVVDLVGKTPLSDLIGVIEGASALVATDTGTAHIASATNTEVFALIGPTPAEQTGPYKTPFNKVHILSVNLECSPCYKTERMKQCRDNICMKQISTEMVYNSIKSAKLW